MESNVAYDIFTEDILYIAKKLYKSYLDILKCAQSEAQWNSW